VLIVGDADRSLAFADQGLRIVTDASTPFGLVALLPGADLEGTLADLAQAGLLAVPIANFTEQPVDRADFQGDYFSATRVHEALSATQSIRDRLRSYPAVPAGSESIPLSILMLAASRETRIAGQLDANTPEGISYPLLRGIDNPRATLEALAEARLLKRLFLDRLYLCGVCGSARVLAREVCPGCKSANLAEQDVIHHYRCGFQASRQDFEVGSGLSCPKCRRQLRHYGVDYDTPTTITICRSCGEITAEPEVMFRCGECRESTRAIDATTADWHDYELLPQAFDVLRQGRMPDVSWQGILADISGRRSPRDLGMFIDHARRIQERYERPFAVLLVDYDLPERTLREAGTQAQQRVRNLVVDVIRQTLRSTDLVTTYEQKILLFLPETPTDHVERVTERLNQNLEETVGPETGIRARQLDGANLETVVNRLLEA
jgi:hypothetical protein